MVSLEKSNWIAGVVAGVIAVLGIPWGVWTYLHPVTSPSPATPDADKAAAARQAITGSSNTQIGSVGGSVTIIAAPSPPPLEPAATEAAPSDIKNGAVPPQPANKTLPTPKPPPQVKTISDFEQAEREAISYACLQRLRLPPQAATSGFALNVSDPTRLVHLPRRSNRLISTRMLDPNRIEVTVSASQDGSDTFLCVEKELRKAVSLQKSIPATLSQLAMPCGGGAAAACADASIFSPTPTYSPTWDYDYNTSYTHEAKPTAATQTRTNSVPSNSANTAADEAIRTTNAAEMVEQRAAEDATPATSAPTAQQDRANSPKCADAVAHRDALKRFLVDRADEIKARTPYTLYADDAKTVRFHADGLARALPDSSLIPKYFDSNLYIAAHRVAPFVSFVSQLIIDRCSGTAAR